MSLRWSSLLIGWKRTTAQHTVRFEVYIGWAEMVMRPRVGGSDGR